MLVISMACASVEADFRSVLGDRGVAWAPDRGPVGGGAAGSRGGLGAAGPCITEGQTLPHIGHRTHPTGVLWCAGAGPLSARDIRAKPRVEGGGWQIAGLPLANRGKFL